MSHITHSASFSPLRRVCLGAALALSLAGCAGPSVQDYAKEQPTLDLRQYFNGPLTAHGMFTERSGKVVKRFAVRMTGRWNGDEGSLEEHFVCCDGSPQERVRASRDPGSARCNGPAEPQGRGAEV